MAYARLCRGIGRLERAQELFIRALEVQPDDYQAPLLLHQILFTLGRKDEAEKYARLGLRRADEALQLHPEGSRPAQLAAPTSAMLGDRAGAIRWLERALWIDSDDAQVQYNLACTWALVGESEKALDMLERWSDQRGLLAQSWLQADPDLVSIRNQPRYLRLLAKIEAEAERALPNP